LLKLAATVLPIVSFLNRFVHRASFHFVRTQLCCRCNGTQLCWEKKSLRANGNRGMHFVRIDFCWWLTLW